MSIACYVSGLSVPNQVSNVVRGLATGKRFLFGDVVLHGFEDPVRLYEVSWRED